MERKETVRRGMSRGKGMGDGRGIVYVSVGRPYGRKKGSGEGRERRRRENGDVKKD